MTNKQIETMVSHLGINWRPGLADVFLVKGKVWPKESVKDLMRNWMPIGIRPRDWMPVAIRPRDGEVLSEMDRIFLWIRQNRSVSPAAFMLELPPEVMAAIQKASKAAKLVSPELWLQMMINKAYCLEGGVKLKLKRKRSVKAKK
jgi:hypothetical protein